MRFFLSLFAYARVFSVSCLADHDLASALTSSDPEEDTKTAEQFCFPLFQELRLYQYHCFCGSLPVRQNFVYNHTPGLTSSAQEEVPKTAEQELFFKSTSCVCLGIDVAAALRLCDC